MMSNANEMSVSGTTMNNKIIQELTHVFLKVVERIFAVCSCRSHQLHTRINLSYVLLTYMVMVCQGFYVQRGREAETVCLECLLTIWSINILSSCIRFQSSGKYLLDQSAATIFNSTSHLFKCKMNSHTFESPHSQPNIAHSVVQYSECK